MSATNPKAVIEVLSPSTRRYDDVAKFQHYSQIPSFEEYILIEQQSYSIERRHRLPNGEWESTGFRGEDANLELAERDPDQP